MAPILEIPGKVDPRLTDIAEVAHPRRPRDMSFYAVLILAVIPIWSIVPLSWVFVLYALRTGKIWSYTWIGQALFALALVEVRFIALSCQQLEHALGTKSLTRCCRSSSVFITTTLRERSRLQLSLTTATSPSCRRPSDAS